MFRDSVVSEDSATGFTWAEWALLSPVQRNSAEMWCFEPSGAWPQQVGVASLLHLSFYRTTYHSVDLVPRFGLRNGHTLANTQTWSEASRSLETNEQLYFENKDLLKHLLRHFKLTF